MEKIEPNCCDKYFLENELGGWDGKLYCRTVPGGEDVRQLTEELPCGVGVIPVGFIWNGATVGILRYAGFLAFPKWKHPIATCRHDWRCSLAETKEERAFADDEFQKDVARTGTRWECIKGYIGVRIGTLFWRGSSNGL